MAQTRVDPRYTVEIDAEIALGPDRFPARTRNLSRGGISIVAPRALPVGEAVGVSLSLGRDERAMSEPLPLRGRVVWSTPLPSGEHQVGVTFVGLTGDGRVYLELFLRYLADV